ncbi:nitroreductase/quinone reductase family protein [Nocardia sp. IFM 10818]
MRLLAAFNRRVTNPVFGRIAGRVPGYANVVHVGRCSGRRYRTPVGTTWRGEELLIAVNYGRGSDWVRNVLAAGEFELEQGAEVVRMGHPRLITLDGRQFLAAESVRGR